MTKIMRALGAISRMARATLIHLSSGGRYRAESGQVAMRQYNPASMWLDINISQESTGSSSQAVRILLLFVSPVESLFLAELSSTGPR